MTTPSPPLEGNENKINNIRRSIPILYTIIGLLTLIIIRQNRRYSQLANKKWIEQLKQQLKIDAGSVSNDRAIDAVKQLHLRAWLTGDGSLLKEANLQGANLEGVDFKDANLMGVDFREANLANANFENVNLAGVDFRDANLEGANFSKSNLIGTKFKGANLQKANLRRNN